MPEFLNRARSFLGIEQKDTLSVNRFEGITSQGCLVLPNSGHFEDEADVQRGAPAGVLDVFAS